MIMTTTNDQERAAYIAGDVRTAELLGRIAELEHVSQTLLTALDLYGVNNLGDEIDIAIGELREVLK